MKKSKVGDERNIEKYLYLVYEECKKFKEYKFEEDELLSSATIGLHKAITDYNGMRDFEVYARIKIKKETKCLRLRDLQHYSAKS